MPGSPLLLLLIRFGLIVSLTASPMAAQRLALPPQTPSYTSTDTPPRAPPRPNLLIILADDIGVDRVAIYGEHPDPGNTPRIDALAEQGILFRNAWANPTCSPTRASMLTGRHAHRTGIGTFIFTYGTAAELSVDLSVDEVSLADVLSDVGYRTAAIGKWHLSALLSDTDHLLHPLLLGFEHHLGPINNLPNYLGPAAWYGFEKSIDGQLVYSSKYATTDQVDDTLDVITSFGDDPWFVWLAFNAPHRPFHAPPPHLHSVDLSKPPLPDHGHSTPSRRGPGLMGLAPTAAAGLSTPTPAATPGNGVGLVGLPAAGEVSSAAEVYSPLFMKAMTEAMDTEIGRLLDSMDPETLARTYIVFVGDNGTNTSAITKPFSASKGKSSLFEGGINVPLIVAGPGIPAGRESAALVHAVDLFATLAELAGADGSSGLDSHSLEPYLQDPELPGPEAVYTERFRPNGFGPYKMREQAARGERYKYVRRLGEQGQLKAEGLYDLESDPFETSNILKDGPMTLPAALAWMRLQQFIHQQG
jgi:arylsulfatase B